MAGEPFHPQPPPPRQTFRRAQRLTHAREFEAVYNARVRKARGGLVVFARPNDLEGFRLGLSVGRSVGGAVVRNRIKRLLRETFRLDHRTWPRGGGYDLVVSVRPHPPHPLSAYRAAMADLVDEVVREWQRRERRDAANG